MVPNQSSEPLHHCNRLLVIKQATFSIAVFWCATLAMNKYASKAHSQRMPYIFETSTTLILQVIDACLLILYS